MTTSNVTIEFNEDCEEYELRQMQHGNVVYIILDEQLINEIKKLYTNPYGYLDALNDLADVQFIDNTIQEAEAAKAEVVKIIKGLCGVE